MLSFIFALIKKALPLVLIPVYLAIIKVFPDFPLSQEVFYGLILWVVIQIFRVGTQAVKAEDRLGKKFWK